MAKPHEGSINRVAHAENDPAMGKMTASSPSAWHVQKSMAPTIVKASNIDAGPPSANALPDATKSPVPVKMSQFFKFNHGASTIDNSPIEPPMAIICKCLPFNSLARPELAVSSIALCKS